MIVLNSSLGLSVYAASFAAMDVANVVAGHHHFHLPGAAPLTAELHPIQIAAELLEAISHGDTNFGRKPVIALAQSFTASAATAVAAETPAEPMPSITGLAMHRTGPRRSLIWAAARERISAGTHRIAAAFDSPISAIWALGGTTT